MIRRMKVTLAIVALLSIAVPFAARAQSSAMVATAQLLDYQKGFVFITTGDGFRVAPGVQIVDAATNKPLTAMPAPRDYARLAFAADGTVSVIALSKHKLPAEGDLAQLHKFAISLSTPAPNPELASAPKGTCSFEGAPHLVPVRFVVQVPPSTQPTDNVYMSTDQSAWNPQAYRMNRVDALHYATTLKFMSGTDVAYLFDRGTTQSFPRAQNGLEQEPFHLCVRMSTVLSVTRVVYHWGDETSSNSVPAPQTQPTPFNPAPFPNLPGATPNPHPTF